MITPLTRSIFQSRKCGITQKYTHARIHQIIHTAIRTFTHTGIQMKHTHTNVYQHGECKFIYIYMLDLMEKRTENVLYAFVIYKWNVKAKLI